MIRMMLAALTFFAAAAAPAYAERAVLRGLDKRTGHATDFNATLGRPARFGTLEVVARACSKRPAEETPEVSIYIEVFDTPVTASGEAGERREIFHGWIFASSPGLNALEHPTYDIWAIDCRA